MTADFGFGVSESEASTAGSASLLGRTERSSLKAALLRAAVAEA
jgi:hypothetical protein